MNCCTLSMHNRTRIDPEKSRVIDEQLNSINN